MLPVLFLSQVRSLLHHYQNSGGGGAQPCLTPPHLFCSRNLVVVAQGQVAGGSAACSVCVCVQAMVCVQW